MLTRRFGGEVEKFIGDGIVAVFNGRGDQPDHALCASAGRRKALEPGALVVLIGSKTYERLPGGAVVEQRTGLRVKGKRDALDAYVLFALP